MLALGGALMSEPRVRMRDEPCPGFAPLIVEEILAIVRSLREDGVSILLVAQNAVAALESSDYGYVLESGEVVLHGKSDDLASDERVYESYLGGVSALHATLKPICLIETNREAALDLRAPLLSPRRGMARYFPPGE